MDVEAHPMPRAMKEALHPSIHHPGLKPCLLEHLADPLMDLTAWGSIMDHLDGRLLGLMNRIINTP